MIYLFGASGHAKVIIEILELTTTGVGGLIDANPKIVELLGYPVNHHPDSIPANGAELIISIGNNAIRRDIARSLAFEFTTAIHPSAVISARANVGEGTVIMAGAVINSSADIGKHVIINTSAAIDHDCVIADYAHVSPNAALAGNVSIGEGAHIGIGASIIQGIQVGKWATIGAGAVIINNVPDYAVVVGNPGKIIKYNHQHNEI